MVWLVQAQKRLVRSYDSLCKKSEYARRQCGEPRWGVRCQCRFPHHATGPWSNMAAPPLTSIQQVPRNNIIPVHTGKRPMLSNLMTV
jgi:hypothetical protein